MEDKPGDAYTPPDKEAVKDLWLSCARPLEKKGKLETMTTYKGTTKRGRDIARNQQHWLSRSVFLMDSDNYDKIDWSKK